MVPPTTLTRTTSWAEVIAGQLQVVDRQLGTRHGVELERRRQDPEPLELAG